MALTKEDMTFYLIFAAILSVSAFLCIFLTRKKENGLLGRIIAISSVVFITLSMLDVFLPDVFMWGHDAATLAGMKGAKIHAILRWFNLVSFTVLPIAVFQKNEYFEKIASFFCLPVALLNVVGFYQYIGYFTTAHHSGLRTMSILTPEFKDFLITRDFRTVFFGLTCFFQLLALILLTYKNRKKLAIAKNQIVNLILIFIGTLYISLPVYVPQYLFGLVDVMMLRFTPIHIAWIISIPAIIVVLWLIFRKKSYEARYLLVLALSWALMLQFSQMFTSSWELNIMKLPLQLCNMGSYLALIMLLKKSQKIYHFALIVNVVGALIAIAILDIQQDISHITHLWTVHYVVEHTKVLIIPILCLVLRIFKPIDMKLTKHFSIGFTLYYLFVWVLGTVSNGFYRLNAGKPIQNFFYANHLFMFDKESAKRLLGFTDPLFENGVIKLGAFEIYPIAQILVYLVFMAICSGICLLIYALTKKERKRYTEETLRENEEKKSISV